MIPYSILANIESRAEFSSIFFEDCRFYSFTFLLDHLFETCEAPRLLLVHPVAAPDKEILCNGVPFDGE